MIVIHFWSTTRIYRKVKPQVLKHLLTAAFHSFRHFTKYYVLVVDDPAFVPKHPLFLVLQPLWDKINISIGNTFLLTAVTDADTCISLCVYVFL